MEENTMKGVCLCGAVSLTTSKKTEVEICHCEMCRRWGGGPFMVIHCVTDGGADIQISDMNSVAVFESSKWAERGFCNTCGTHLFYRLKESNNYSIPVGLFQNQEGYEMKEQIFIDKKPDYYSFANDTPVLTEAEVFQKYASK